jgi:hypothetical protein
MQTPSNQDVPPRLEPIFEGGREIHRLGSTVNEIKRRLFKHSEELYGLDIDIDTVIDACETLLKEILHGRPFDLCDCNGRLCKKCGGKGWLSVKRIVQLVKSSALSENQLEPTTFQAVRRFVDLG